MGSQRNIHKNIQGQAILSSATLSLCTDELLRTPYFLRMLCMLRMLRMLRILLNMPYL
jgi:hypothetical protein